MYKALYRSYRPKNFEELVGQNHISDVLKNQAASGRISHAYLFSGPRGTGKTSTALLFARAVNCTAAGQKPCGACHECRNGDSDIIEIDAASNNGVDEVRDLRDKIRFAPVAGKYRIYIIDEVHMLSIQAFNALLKTLEEPPAHIVFILATTEPRKLPATIVSRCQRYDFHRVPVADIVKRMETVAEDIGASFEHRALHAIARSSEGGLRDALSLMDQMLSVCGNTVTYTDVLSVLGSAATEDLQKLALSLGKGNATEAILQFNRHVDDGKDMGALLGDLSAWFRDALVAFYHSRGAVECDDETYAQLNETAKEIGAERLLRALEILNKAENELRFSNPRYTIEAAMLRICRPQDERGMAAVLDRLEKLEQSSGGDPAYAAHELDTIEKRIRQLEAGSVKHSEKAPAGDMETEEKKAAEKRISPKEQEPAAKEEEKQAPAESKQDNSSDHKALWQKILQQLEQTNMGVYTMAREALLAVFEENALSVVFDEAKKIYTEVLKMGPNHAVLCRAAESVLGKTVLIHCIVNQENSGQERMVSQAKALFGDEIEIQ
ncbi:MAG: DNA polymerase III subunit gamma/tau [Christensenellales bacterium]